MPLPIFDWPRTGPEDNIHIMGNLKRRVNSGRDGQGEFLLLRRSHYRRLLRRIEDLEDALALDRAENSSRKLPAYAEVRERLKRVGKLRAFGF